MERNLSGCRAYALSNSCAVPSESVSSLMAVTACVCLVTENSSDFARIRKQPRGDYTAPWPIPP
jgi:hypothetical protein